MEKKNPAAQALGRLGGKARAKSLSYSELSKIGKKGALARVKSLTAAERSEIARKAVQARTTKLGQKPRKGVHDKSATVARRSYTDTATGDKGARRPKGTGCIYRRADSPVHWIKYSPHGKPYRESTHTTDKKKAIDKLKNRLAEITTGTFVDPQAERVRVEELAEDFIREYRINGRKSLEDAETRWT